MKNMKKKILFLASAFILGSSSLLLGNQPTDLELWGSPVSPFVRKVESVLKYKHLDYVLHETLPKVLLEAKNQEVPEAFLKASPLGKIPALKTNTGNIADSSVIVAYIEKRFPHNPVYPSNPQKLADVLWMEKYADTVMTETIHKIFFERVVKPTVLNIPTDEDSIINAINVDLPKILSYLNEKVENSKYLVGDEITLADYAVAHHFISIDSAKIEWKNGNYKALESYYLRMLNDKAFSETIPEMLKK